MDQRYDLALALEAPRETSLIVRKVGNSRKAFSLPRPISMIGAGQRARRIWPTTTSSLPLQPSELVVSSAR